MENLIKRIKAARVPKPVLWQEKWRGEFIHKDGKLVYVYELADLEKFGERDVQGYCDIQDHLKDQMEWLFDDSSDDEPEEISEKPDDEDLQSWLRQSCAHRAYYCRDKAIELLQAGDIDQAILALKRAHLEAPAWL